VQLGMSPTAVIHLLEFGHLPSHLGEDGRTRRIMQTDVDAHRESRFALRQQMVQEQRARRWAEPPLDPPHEPQAEADSTSAS